MKKLTKIFAGTAIAATLIIGTAAFAACGNNGTSAGGGSDKLTADTPQEAYGISAATAGMVISGMNGGSAADAVGASAAMNGRAQVTDEETIASLNEYMALVEGLLADGGFAITGGANENTEFAQYENVMTVTYTTMDGGKISYTTYYNQTLTGSYTEQDDEPWEDDEVTDVYSVEGVMVIDGAAYPLEGRFVNETEGRESENTHYLRVDIDAAAGNWLTVTQETENEDDESENEYVYTTYSGGRIAERTTFEFESERGETEIVMSIDDRVNGTRSYFEFERETERGREIIKINADGREYIVRTETDENGNSQYVYYSGGNRIGRGDTFDFDD